MGVNDRAAVRLRIGELVLHGVDARDRARIGAAVERELVRLLRSAPLDARRPVRADRIDGGSFGVPGMRRPDALGAGIAQAIHRSLRGGTDRS
jgi:hypothetical protein